MTEYRIAEEHNRFRIQYSNGMVWHDLVLPHVPRFFDSLEDARAWVATIKRGVVYHEAEDAPNLAQDERKAEDDTSDGIKPLEWFEERVGSNIVRVETIKNTAWISHYSIAKAFHQFQTERGYRYKDQP